jgi:hypothetical protein
MCAIRDVAARRRIGSLDSASHPVNRIRRGVQVKNYTLSTAAINMHLHAIRSETRVQANSCARVATRAIEDNPGIGNRGEVCHRRDIQSSTRRIQKPNVTT